MVDASNQTVGRLAGQVAQILKGKHKPTYRPNKDMGDFVVVVNAEKVRVSKVSRTTMLSHIDRVAHLQLYSAISVRSNFRETSGNRSYTDGTQDIQED